ncbi:MAG TPA: alpha/beta fold hydrolase [Caulobacteraceae bacterium]|jgi:homoserine O-acetyltransferase|nr:alpha/beta fold hydrolase [Caulobacteraceae bacterium]
MCRMLTAALAAFALAAAAHGQTPTPGDVREDDFIVHDFAFDAGGRLPELRLHYRTLGTPIRGRDGQIVNAVLILHGTGGTGAQFLRPQFAGELFGPGQLLDTNRYYIILPDDIGHGGSSKPSDALRARFPHYGYGDMVRAEHALVTEGLGVKRLRLIMGTSMGCMHAFLWGENYPQGMAALMPLACLPVTIAGRNRLWRRMVIQAIEADPAWKGGDYATEPAAGLRTAEDILAIAGSAPQQMQISLATPADGDRYLAGPIAKGAGELDADDLVYQVDSSRDYDPSARLEAITAPVMWINSADDFINPPELGIAERLAPRLERGRFVLLPISPLTHGHGTHTWAVAWKAYLAQLLAESGG